MMEITKPGELMEIVNAFKMSRMILSGIELKIFDPISSGSMTSEEVAGSLGTDPRATDRLLNALSGTGLLIKTDGYFSNSPFSQKFLVTASPYFMSGLGHSADLWKTWSSLTDVVKSGKNTYFRGEINDRGPEWLESFIGTMHARGVAQGRELASMLDLSNTHRVLDVGGGSGAFIFGFIEKNPAITGVILDLPNVTPITRNYIEKAGFTDSVTTLDGDYHLADLGHEFDLVLMSAIIHINNPEENRILIRKGADALTKGGQLVIMDHVMNEERTEPFIGAIFALNMLVGTKHGDTFTESEIRGWMKDAGLTDIRLMTAESGMQVMVGRG
jgi:SAM-dependent methyltransferase